MSTKISTNIRVSKTLREYLMAKKGKHEYIDDTIRRLLGIKDYAKRDPARQSGYIRSVFLGKIIRIKAKRKEREKVKEEAKISTEQDRLRLIKQSIV